MPLLGWREGGGPRRARQIAIEAQRRDEPLDEKPVTLAINEVAEGRFDAKSIDTAISDEA